MRTSSKLKNLLIRIIIAVILFLAKQYLNLDFINDLVDKIIIIIISALLLDFNTFSLEITKVFFNGNNGDEGEGSNRQNNNTPNQDTSISPHEEASEEELMEDPLELMGCPKEPDPEELIEDPEVARQKIL
jgi:DNA integrity scanning protein DisA with diadenylate cyclase activity